VSPRSRFWAMGEAKMPSPTTNGPERRSQARLDRWTWPGLLVIAISIFLLRVFPNRMPDLPGGMVTPVLAFELVRTPGEVERMFGTNPDERARFALRMKRGTWGDFALLAAYGVFLAGVAYELSRDGSRGAKAGVVLALGAAAFDVAENLQLLDVVANLGGRYEGALTILSYATWGKWWCLAAYFLAIARPAWALGGFPRAGAVFGVAGSVAALAAFPLRGVPAEIMLNGTSIGIAGFVVGTYRQRLVEQRRAQRR
jgi:hypothetical protein